MSAASTIITLGRPDADAGLGQPGERVIGTKTSGPPGIESILEYNGLYLNVREWVDTYIVTNIDGIDDAEVIDSREPNPTDDGETPFAARYGGRTIVLTGKIQTKTLWKLRDMQSALRKAFSDLSSEKALIFRTTSQDTDLVSYCKKQGKIQMGEEQQTQNSFERSFQITLRASNPRFVGYKENVSRKKWGYTELFSDTSPSLIENKVPNPRGGGTTNTFTYPFASPMVVTQGAAPTPLLSSGTSWKADGNVATSASTVYPGIYMILSVPATAIPNVTSVAFYARQLWTAIPPGSNISGMMLRWSNSGNPGAGGYDQYAFGQADTSNMLNVVREGTIVGTVPALTGGVAPDTVQVIAFTTLPGNAAGGQATVYLTDVTVAYNTTTIPVPFDGDSPGAYWTGTPYASSSVKYQAYTNEFANPDMDTDHPDATWKALAGTNWTGYDGLGGVVLNSPGGTGVIALDHQSAPTLRPGDVWSFRTTITCTVSGFFTAEIRANGVSYYSLEAPGTSSPLSMEAGKSYTFNWENVAIDPAAPGAMVVRLVKRNSSGTSINQTAGTMATFTNVIAIRGKVPTGMMSSSANPIVVASALSSDWAESYGKSSVHSEGGRLVFDNTSKQVWLTRKAARDGVSNRALTMKFRTPSTITGTTSYFGQYTRRTSNNNWIGATFSPTGANTARLYIVKRQAGVTSYPVNNGTTFNVAPDTDYTMSFVTVDNVVTARLFSGATQLAAVTYTLTGAEIAAFGTGVIGDDGIVNTGGSTNRGYKADEFNSEPLAVGPVVSHQVVNSGDYSAQPIVRIYGVASKDSSVPANAGSIAMTILNESNGEVLAIKCKDGSFTAIGNDRYLELDIAKKTMKEYVASTGALVGNAFDRLDPGSDWLTLRPGNNVLTTRYFMASGQPQVDFRWRRTHM